MNGAESLLTTLVNNGVEVCFTNPGTSEMHFVAALDEVEGMRCVLCLFEGVLSGAADGYARMARKPASTLLHLGPGLGNALANIHNAKKGHVPVVNIVGDHATYHLQYDAPLTADIEGIARPVSHWVYTSKAPGDIARDAAEAVRQAGIGQVATLMLPADVSWGDNPNGPEGRVAVAPPAAVPAARLQQALALLQSGASCMVMIGGREIDGERGLLLSRIGKAAGARVCTEVFPGRVARGADTAVLDRLPYLAELAIDHIKDIEHLILVGAPAPVSFFAYPNVPSAIAAPGCQQFVLAGPNDDIDQVLADLLEGLGAVDVAPDVHPLSTSRPGCRAAGCVQAGRGGGSFPAGKRCRGGRVHHLRLRPVPGHSCGPAPRLAQSHRRQHRLGVARRGGRRRRLPRAQGDMSGRGRQRDVHHPVPVDHGPGKPRCHRGDIQ